VWFTSNGVFWRDGRGKDPILSDLFLFLPVPLSLSSGVALTKKKIEKE